MGYKLMIYFVTPVIVLIGIRKLREYLWGYCHNSINLKAKVAIVTGANSGIGFQVAKELAKRNATVILACRNMDLANEAIIKIQKEVGKPSKLVAMELDLASLKSVQHFAEEVQKLYTKIHLLVNNAGVAFPRNQLHFTEDHVEMHFGVNHLGHHYLTNLLLDTLKKSAPSRIVVVSSSLHERGKLDFKKLGTEQDTKLYANSKLATIYFTIELAKRSKGSGVNVYALCPGWVYTSLFRHSFKWYHYILILPIAFFFMRTPYQGAQTVIYCATEPKLKHETGLLYRNCKIYTSKMKFDPSTALKLWNKSEEMIQSRHIK